VYSLFFLVRAVLRLEDGDEGRDWILEKSGMAKHAKWEDKHRGQGWKDRHLYRYANKPIQNIQ
jgi:hypothetical protein